jgi:hypothetical protein
VSLSPELRSALQTIGNATIGVALGMSVLGAAFVVSQFAARQGSVAGSAPTATATGGSSVLVVAAAPTSPPPPAPTASPISPSPPPRPTDPPSTATPTPSPTSVTPYSSGGRRYAALRAPLDYAFVAPFAGTIQVRLYQLIDGQVRVGSNVPALPFFPYVTLESADRRIIYRPGALNVDTELLVKDGDRAEVATPLFKTIGEGPSSWRTFYDRSVTANVIASVAALPSGAELDPVAFFSTP